MMSNYDEMRDRVRLLDQTLERNRELEMQLASLKKQFSHLKEANINKTEHRQKEEAKKQAYLQDRERLEGTPVTEKIGFWEFAAGIGAIPKTAKVYKDEQARRLGKYGS